MSVTLNSPVTAGSLVALDVGWGDSSTPPTTVTLGSQSFSVGTSVVSDVGDNQYQQGYYLIADGAGATVITATWVGSISYRAVNAREFGGMNTTSPLIVGGGLYTHPTTTTTDATTSGAITTEANSLIVACAQNSESLNAINVGTGYTQSAVTGDATHVFTTSEYKAQATAGSVTATFTSTVTGSAIVTIMAFRVASTAIVPHGRPQPLHKVAIIRASRW